MCVAPCHSRVAVPDRVVAVPRRGAVEGLRVVVEPVAVPAEEEQAVVSVLRSGFVEFGDLVGESLPLRFAAMRVVRRIARVFSIYKPEIGGREVERGRVGGGVILQEVPRHRGVVDVSVMAVVPCLCDGDQATEDGKYHEWD